MRGNKRKEQMLPQEEGCVVLLTHTHTHTHTHTNLTAYGGKGGRKQSEFNEKKVQTEARLQHIFRKCDA